MNKITPFSRIYVAGHRGLVGSAIMRELSRRGCEHVISASRAQLDLRNQSAVNAFFGDAKPDFVFLAAAKVGGILANSTLPAEFLYDNLTIQTNIIHAAWRNGVRKLVFLGSSCIYPQLALQPIKEEYLLTGPLEPTNEAYAIAKIAGLKMCAAYRSQYGFNAISLMPTNLYGPADNFDLATSHVLPALIRRYHEAKLSGVSEVVLWGTGTPRREFLHVDDMASAACFALENYEASEPLNVGTGKDLTIAELASTVARIVEYTGATSFDSSKPDGTPRKLLDVSRLTALGWQAQVPIEEGIAATYAWYQRNVAQVGTAVS